jgi:hypothetical protein
VQLEYSATGPDAAATSGMCDRLVQKPADRAYQVSPIANNR